uniref:Uncharacterized protein n=1 Tax=Rhizophora mucronata TaxID=61149 RepID=A0A2P2J3S2_RHIMU
MTNVQDVISSSHFLATYLLLHL